MPNDNPPETAPALPRNMPEVKERLRQLWEGQIPLAQTFWLYYFAAIFVLELLAKTGEPLGSLFSLIALAWAGFMVKPIIAAADHYKGDKIWAYIAKAAAIVIALGVLSNLLSL